MQSRIILVPLGGIGDRFKQSGYLQPKALIPVFGKCILYYLLDCIKINSTDTIYIPYNKEYQNYYFEEKVKKDYPHFSFMFAPLEKNTNGAAETIAFALSKLSCDDCPVLCLDGDNFYRDIDIIKLWNNQNAVFVFNSSHEEPIYSYVIHENNNISAIAEKIKISDNACSGAYGFASWKLLQKYAHQFVNINNMYERYISGIISTMISSGIKINAINIDKKNFICLGTPLQLQNFYYNYPKITCDNNQMVINPKRYCFDLDNTLITSPVIPGDYSTVLPIQKNIDFLKYLHRFGNTIIIYTARRMKTHNGNVGKVVADVGQQTMDTLTKFGIPYDEIYFGKPYADAYIDDLAVNHQSVDLEKYLGWYSSAATIAPRSFNKIVHSSIETITKTSRYTLSGEIYWYLNIHPQLKDIFPLLIDYSLEPDSMYYVIEKIEGVSVSSLYLSELLTPIMLNNILNTITRIQKIVPDFCLKHDLNIYANYTDKLCSRYTSNREFYALFPESQSCYDVITMRLEHYSANNLGRISCIHGDPVFTNIMINNYSKIKMFDMRGKLGDVETIYGDWLYDWAKIYQSLLGYDAILNNKPISLDYKTKMLAEFETYFLSRNTKADFEMLKTITCSLLFSLLPLHKENLDNCNKFYALINL